MSYFQILLEKLAAGSSQPPALVSPRWGEIGDSHTQNGNAFSLVTGTQTRDGTTGVITGAATAANSWLFGTPECYLIWMTDTTFEIVGRNNYTSGGSTLGTVAGSSTTYALYPSGTPILGGTTTAATANASITNWDRFTTRSMFANLQALYGGGLQFIGNFGHGGLQASQTTLVAGQITTALTFSPQVLRLMLGTNDAKSSGQTGATIFANVKLAIDQIIAGGAFVVVCAVPPVGSAINSNGTFGVINLNVIGDPNNGAVTTSLNYLLKQYVATKPTNAVFADTFNPVCDKVTDPSNWRLYDSTSTGFPTMTADGVHIFTNGAMVQAAAIKSVTTNISANGLLARSAADQGTTVNGHTRFVARGPWVTTTGGTFTTGGSGSISPGWQAGVPTGTGTIVCSLVDPGDGLGIKVHAVCTPAGANERHVIWPWANGGVTLATLGLPGTPDNSEYAVACEVDWTNAVASGLGLVQLSVVSNSSGLYATANCGEGTAAVGLEAAGILPDTATARVLVTGWFQYSNTSFTAMTPQVAIFFNAITGVSATVNVRAFTLMKR